DLREIDVEEAIENRMVVRGAHGHGERLRTLPLREQIAVVRVGIAFDGVEHDEPAALGGWLVGLKLSVAERPTAALGENRRWIGEQLTLVETNERAADDRPALDERPDRRDLAQDVHEVRLGARIVVRPARSLAPAFVGALVLDARERNASVVARIALEERRDE